MFCKQQHFIKNCDWKRKASDLLIFVLYSKPNFHYPKPKEKSNKNTSSSLKISNNLKRKIKPDIGQQSFFQKHYFEIYQLGLDHLKAIVRSTVTLTMIVRIIIITCKTRIYLCSIYLPSENSLSLCLWNKINVERVQ